MDEIELPDIDLPSIDLPTATISEPKRAKIPRGSQVTSGNARSLAFLGHFPAADSEALSMIAHRKESHSYPGGVLPTVKGTEKRLLKLERLGVLDREKNPATGVNHYGITKNGIAAAWSYGYDMEHAATTHRLSYERLTHYRMIAHVAAQLVSPEGYFRNSLGIEPVALDQLWNERRMRTAFDPIKRKLEDERAKGQRGSFADWRAKRLHAVLSEVKSAVEAAGDDERKRKTVAFLKWSSLVERHPELLTLGLAQTESDAGKLVYQPDLAVLRDERRTGPKAQNLLIEVELSKKSWNGYDAILSTLAAELSKPFVYDRAVYFYVGTQIPTLIKKVDAAGEYDLIRSGRLVLMPLIDRNGTEIELQKRIEKGAI